ncbi:MAG: response regulator [Gammaproteobacteria bacterium]|nr:response regulator [Gammaproteobacteria bacterium]
MHKLSVISNGAQANSDCKNMPVRRLLVVDDEENIIRSLVRLLRPEGYEILTANSGEQGLEVLKTEQVGVVLSDQRMPGMSGTEFLSKVRDLYPGTVRIVLSGYTDLKTITEAINEGEIYKFLTKPWDDELLKANVVDSFRQFELVNENDHLNRQLQIVNDELKKANEKLELNFNYQKKNAEINFRSLQVTQQIMENMPIGIMGVDNNEMIVLANSMAHKMLGANPTRLFGDSISNVMEQALLGKIMDESEEEIKNIIDGSNGIHYLVYKKSDAEESWGKIIMLIPDEVLKSEVN